MSQWTSVLRPGDWVRFDGDDHQVVTLVGVSVRLRSTAGAEMVVLAAHLMGSPGFEVITGDPVPQLPPLGLLDALPPDAVAAAREWERHIVEVTTGLMPDAGPGATPRPDYDPATRTLSQRENAKAAELAASGRPIGVRTLQRMRARYPAGSMGAGGSAGDAAVGNNQAGRRAGGQRRSRSAGRRDRGLHRNPVTADPAGKQGAAGNSRLRRGADSGQDHVLQADRHAFDGSPQLRVGGDPTPDRQPSGGAIHADVGGASRRTGADRLHTVGCDGGVGAGRDRARGSDDRRRCRVAQHLRGGAAAGRHQSRRRGAVVGADAGARTDAAGLGGVAADVGVSDAARGGWSTSTRGWRWRPRNR
jgi:hypothetical protein